MVVSLEVDPLMNIDTKSGDSIVDQTCSLAFVCRYEACISAPFRSRAFLNVRKLTEQLTAYWNWWKWKPLLVLHPTMGTYVLKHNRDTYQIGKGNNGLQTSLGRDSKYVCQCETEPIGNIQDNTIAYRNNQSTPLGREHWYSHRHSRSVTVANTKVPKLERPACQEEKNSGKPNIDHPRYCNQVPLLSIAFPLSGRSIPGFPR